LYFFKERNRGVALSFIFILTVILVLYNIDSIISYSLAIIVEEDLKEGRVNLYSKAIEIMKTSPIFGVGPGGHIWTNSKFYDSHQTFFTVMLQAGIIGVFILGKLFSKIIKTLIKSPPLFASLVTIIVYLLGGDIMRRLPTWIILVLVFYYQKETVYSKTETT
jgi:O-antigen ligase